MLENLDPNMAPRVRGSKLALDLGECGRTRLTPHPPVWISHSLCQFYMLGKRHPDLKLGAETVTPMNVRGYPRSAA